MKRTKLLAVLLTALLIVSAFPAPAFAARALAIEAESPTEITVYSPDEEFAFEVKVDSPTGDFRCKWYQTDPDGLPIDFNEDGTIRVLGDGTAFLIFGIPQEKMNEWLYYRCEVTEGSTTLWLDFRCVLFPIGYEDDEMDGPVKTFEITKNPDRIAYKQGDQVDLSGIHYKVTYEDGSYMESIIPEVLMWYPPVLNEAGSQEITVGYKGMTDTYMVRVEEVPGFEPLPMDVDYEDPSEGEYEVDLELMEEPTKKVYKVGEPIDLSGIKCRLWTSMGFKDITDPTAFTTFPATAQGTGKQTISVEYKGHFAVSYEIEVENTDFSDQEYETDLEMTKSPNKMEYTVGEPIDLTGMECRLYTTLGFRDIKDLSGLSFYPDKAEEPGEQSIFVDYKGLVEFEFKVQVYPKGPEGAPAHPFDDIPEGAYYEQAVSWAAQTGVTDGNGQGQFLPFQLCTRGQVVTFLWRAMGRPEPKTTVNPFTDVKESDWFYKPVLWAVENKITDGTTATTFSPYVQCRNSHILTFLWRTLGRPGDTGAENTATWWADALNWAESNGLLKDTVDPEDGSFFVQGLCPRCNVVTYLYRAMNMLNASVK
ncbi:MAG: S-layer homology domain-containing protein [Firmicutes bacterium]|nr:S-layer homology domain-containing protein [Bacillota bacterium]